MTIVRKQRASEARAEQRKTVAEWFSSAPSSKKVRDLLPFAVKTDRNRMPGVKASMTATIEAVFETGPERAESRASGSLQFRVSDDGHLSTHAVFNGIFVRKPTAGDVDDAYHQMSALTAGNLFIDMNTHELFIPVRMDYNGQIAESDYEADNVSDAMTASECAEFLKQAADKTSELLKEKVVRAATRFTGGSSEEDIMVDTDDMNSVPVTLSFGDLSNAIKCLGQMKAEVKAAAHQTNDAYKGKDLFGNDYAIDFDSILRDIDGLSSTLSTISGKTFNAVKDRAMLESLIGIDESIATAICSIWNAVLKSEEALHAFISDGDTESYTDMMSYDDDILDAIYSANPAIYFTEICDEEGMHLDIMEPCVGLLDDILENIGNVFDSVDQYDDPDTVINKMLDCYKSATAADGVETFHVYYPVFKGIEFKS